MTLRPLTTAAALVLGAAGLSGCAGSIDGPISPAFGEALASVNAQARQTPVSDLPPESSGQVAAAAVQRYQEGRTRPVPSYATSAIGGMDDAGDAGSALPQG